MMQYNEVISKLREVARDLLRLNKVNRLRTTRLDLTNELNRADKNMDNEAQEAAKHIARKTFSLSQLNEADPDHEEKKESLEKGIQNIKESLATSQETYAKWREGIVKSVAEVDEKIAKVQAGESPVNADELSHVTEDLIREFSNDSLRGILEQMTEGNEPESTERAN